MPIFSFIGHILQNLFGKVDNWRPIYIQASPSFYTSNDMCLQNYMFRRKSISYEIFKNFKHVSLYMLVEIPSSANANGVLIELMKRRSKVTYHVGALKVLTNKNIFPKTISQ